MVIIFDITEMTPVWIEGLGYNKELYEDEYTSDRYIPATIYNVLPVTYKMLLGTLCMSDT